MTASIELRNARPSRTRSTAIRSSTKFMYSLMFEGKKSTAETIVYGALADQQRRSGAPALEAFHEPLNNVKPVFKSALAASAVRPTRCQWRSATPSSGRRDPLDDHCGRRRTVPPKRQAFGESLMPKIIVEPWLKKREAIPPRRPRPTGALRITDGQKSRLRRRGWSRHVKTGIEDHPNSAPWHTSMR